jgi:hypothetical protein
MSDALPTPAPSAPTGADPLCISCGYNLRGLTLPTRCPECGERVSAGAPSHGFELADRDVQRVRIAIGLWAVSCLVPLVTLLAFTILHLTVPLWLHYPADQPAFYTLSKVLGRIYSYSAGAAPLLAVAGTVLVAALQPMRRGKRRILCWALFAGAAAAFVGVGLSLAFIPVTRHPQWYSLYMRLRVPTDVLRALWPVLFWTALLLVLQRRERRLKATLLCAIAIASVEALVIELGVVLLFFNPFAWAPPLTMVAVVPPPQWVSTLNYYLALALEYVLTPLLFAKLLLLWYLARRLGRAPVAESPSGESA